MWVVRKRGETVEVFRTGGNAHVYGRLVNAAWFDLEALPIWPGHWPLVSVFRDYRARAQAREQFVPG